MDVYLSPSTKYDKKYMVKIGNHVIHFGAAGYDDYTTHHDDRRKANYIQRHQAREDWDDYFTAGFWSRWLLWNKPTIIESIEDIEQRYPLYIYIAD